MHAPSAWATEGSEPAHGDLGCGALVPTLDTKIVLALCLDQTSCRLTLLPRGLSGRRCHLCASHLTVTVGEEPSKELESK